jgi:hypothetical protein
MDWAGHETHPLHETAFFYSNGQFTELGTL